MSDKYNFPFYIFPKPPRTRVSPRTLEKVYTEKKALFFCGKFNLEDKLDDVNAYVLEDRKRENYLVVYENEKSIYHSTILEYVDVENYTTRLKEKGRNYIANLIKNKIKDVEYNEQNIP